MTRILIDMQACQNASRHRGIGRYVDALVTAMIEIAKSDEFHLLINSAFPETIPAFRQKFSELVDPDNIHVVDVVTPNSVNDADNLWRNDASALLRENFIEYIAPDVVFCPSYFEGFGDDVVISIGRISSIPVVVTLHDLVPLIYKEQYLWGNVGFSNAYYAKLAEIKRCAGLITISESASSEAVELLGFSPEQLVNASEAAGSIFRQIDYSQIEKKNLLRRFSIEQPFVFYTGGSDPRKNLPKLLTAFAALSDEVLDKHQLVFAGGIPKVDLNTLTETAQKLGIEDNVKFVGYVCDEDLIGLYNLAEAFVFPSFHEGFGLPPLEAMQCGTPAIGSNTSSIPEVIGLDDAMFDPNSINEITEKLERVLTDPEFREKLITFGLEQANSFSWEKSAEKALEGIKRFTPPKEYKQRSWAESEAFFDACDQKLIEAISKLPVPRNGISNNDLMRLSQAMVKNRLSAETMFRPVNIDIPVSWRLEGPFDSSYSLAMVNRELARALEANGQDVSLLSSEGPGDFAPDDGFLARNLDLASMYSQAVSQEGGRPTISSRNMYPPRVSDMKGLINGLHNYAWEETGFPSNFVASFNESLQFITVTSEHVKKILIDNGVSVPVAVVGNGVDHWNRIEADVKYSVQTAGYTFLHVSSCFPRKGSDVLLESYGRAFTSNDDVLLIIKTFPNPHNEIEKQLAEIRKKFPKYPQVSIIMDDLSDEELKALYQQCDTLVAPSRAEGFGLPIAEAMLSDMDVITTAWSGQMDFCNSKNVDLIEFTYAAADTHEGVYDSIWAEPDLEHLSSLMKASMGKKRRSARALKVAVNKLLKNHSWSEVARRNVEAVQNIISSPCRREPNIGWVSTYNKRCGIATYSEHLLGVLGVPVTVLAESASDASSKPADNVVQCWQEGETDTLEALLKEISNRNFDLIVIQFNYGFFNFDIFNQFLNKLADTGCKIVVTLHSTADPAHAPHKKLSKLTSGLSRCARLLVHSVHDLNRLKALGLDKNATLFPHGVRVPKLRAGTTKPIAKRRDKPINVASYGFFLPNKGLLELIYAMNILRKRGQNFKLSLVNSEFPAEISATLIKEARSLIHSLNLAAHIELCTDFLSDEDSMELLSKADIIVYPYQQTGESASGAVRYGLASGIPVAVSPLTIFDDVADIVYKLPGIAPDDIAQGIEDLTQKIIDGDAIVKGQCERADKWRDAHSYPILGRRLNGMLRGIFKDKIIQSR